MNRVVKLRAPTSAIATFVVAIVVAVAMPVSQLRTFAVTTTCCCPDPTTCHCPHEKPDHSQTPAMRTCHRVQHVSIAPQLPGFTQPESVVALAPPRVAPAPIAIPRAPHAAPASDEPYGPS
jgi:hypothetical protein